MINTMRNEYTPDAVSHPGETLAEVLVDRGMSQVELATRIGRPRKTVSEIIGGKAAITSETALQLERALSIPASFWNALESNYREFQARKDESKRLEAETDWLREIPVRKLANLGWIEKHSDPVMQVRVLLDFFGVVSPDQWRRRTSELQAAFRQSSAFSVDSGAVSAWLRKGELVAQQIHCKPFDKERFMESLRFVRSLTTEKPEKFVSSLIKACSSSGVAVAFIPEVTGARISGAARWINQDKALIQLSLRYKTNDHLWYTFFHEAAHICLHGKKLVFLDSKSHAANEGQEIEANTWAANWLIPPRHFKAFASKGQRISKGQVVDFAASIGIAPGIVVGRLQHENLVQRAHMNGLKVRLDWAH